MEEMAEIRIGHWKVDEVFLHHVTSLAFFFRARL
jgi:hypothetical protein